MLTLTERVGKKSIMGSFLWRSQGIFFVSLCRLVENETQHADAGFMSEPDADG